MKKKQKKPEVSKLKDMHLQVMFGMKPIIYRFYLIISFVLLMFKLGSYAYTDINFIDLPNTILFGASFVIVGYFLLLTVWLSTKFKYFTEIELELYEENVVMMTGFIALWYILSHI